MTTLKNKTIVISGGSRGIGLAIAVRAARDGANVAILAKTAEPHPTLEGTIHTAARAIEDAGGRALPMAVDIRDDESVDRAVDRAADHFDGIDAVINNASAIHLSGTAATPMKKYDLMMDVNCRGTFALVRAAIPHLRRAAKPDTPARIVTLSPPLNLLNPGTQWMGRAPAYMLSKFGMSLLTANFAAELKGDNIHANTIWPASLIATDAIRVNFPTLYDGSRRADIVGDAVHALLTGTAGTEASAHYSDEDILRRVGIEDFSTYAITPGAPIVPDLFLD